MSVILLSVILLSVIQLGPIHLCVILISIIVLNTLPYHAKHNSHLYDHFLVNNLNLKPNFFLFQLYGAIYNLVLMLYTIFLRQ